MTSKGFVRTLALAVAASVALASTAAAQEGVCPNGRSREGAMWLSILHPGLGEYHLNRWGNFGKHCPQLKFWLGFIPFFGWPGYLQVKSAVDARKCRTNDELWDWSKP